MKPEQKIKRRIRRHARTRKFVSGSESKPRVSVFRSNKHIYAQIIDDVKRVTVVSASDYKIKSKNGKPVEIATAVGKLLGKEALSKKIKEVVFDKSGYKYHGRIKALAEGLRESGVSF
jgi:large subunit ribosomal protein L18